MCVRASKRGVEKVGGGQKKKKPRHLSIVSVLLEARAQTVCVPLLFHLNIHPEKRKRKKKKKQGAADSSSCGLLLSPLFDARRTFQRAPIELQ